MDPIIETHFMEQLKQQHAYWQTKEQAFSRNSRPHDTVQWGLKIR